jgi:hypothetical protein
MTAVGVFTDPMVKQDPYEPPRLIVHGSVETLTLQSSGNDGNDPCRYNDPRDAYKQTGVADLIQGQANLATCVGTSA